MRKPLPLFFVWIALSFFFLSLVNCAPVSSSPNKKFTLPPGTEPMANELTHQLFKAYQAKGKTETETCELSKRHNAQCMDENKGPQYGANAEK